MNEWLSLEALSRLFTNGLYVRNLHQHKIEQINFDVVLSCPQTFILPFFYECSSAPEQARKNKLGAGQSLKRKLGVCEQANVVLPLIYYIYTICTRTWKFLLRFSKTRELWSSKAASSQLRFSLPSIIITMTRNEPWNTETHKMDQIPPITNHKRWPFQLNKENFYFLRWLTAAKTQTSDGFRTSEFACLWQAQ